MNPTGFAQATAHAETGADLAIIPGALVPAEVFADGGVDRILADLKARAKSEPVDISTPQGRAALKSLCYKISRSKTALDGMGKELGEDHHARWTAINKDRKRIRDELDALNEEIRAPLTEWEAKDYARIMGHELALAEMESLAVFVDEPDMETIKERWRALITTHARDWEEFQKRADEAREAVSLDLDAARDHWTAVYAERAEAERLRAEEAARVQRERDAAIAAAAAETAKREAEAKAAAAREAEAERVRREAAAAEARRLAEVTARQEAEERARQAEASRIAAAAAAERARVAAAEKAEQDRLAAIANERRLIEEERLAAARDAAAREANTKHRAKVNREARDALNTVITKADEASDDPLSLNEIAEAVVSAIARGLIPHTRITY